MPPGCKSHSVGFSKSLAVASELMGALSLTKTTALLCKMGATIAMLSAELQRLKYGAGAVAMPEGGRH